MIKLISDIDEVGEEDVIAQEPAFQPPREVLTPLYQRLFYGKLYNSLKWSALLDRNWLLNLLTFGTHNRLIEACVNEVDTHSKVLQLGGTFGNQLPELADKVGFYGRLDVIDINRTQISRLEGKYETLYPQMHFIQQNAENPIGAEYDTVVCYMLLHELPIASKLKWWKMPCTALTKTAKSYSLTIRSRITGIRCAGLSNSLTGFTSRLPKNCGIAPSILLPVTTLITSGTARVISAVCIRRWWRSSARKCMKKRNRQATPVSK